MGLFSTLKKGLVESGYLEPSVLTTETPAAPAPSTPTPTVAPVSRLVTPTITPAKTGPANIDPEIVETLQQVVTTRSKMKGYDEFQTLLTAMAGLPDESMRYSMALNALKAAHGIEPAKVLQAVDERLSLLATEEQTFMTKFEQHRTETVTATRDKLANISSTIEQKEQEIARLREEAKTLTDGLVTMETELTKTQQEFNVSLDSLRSALTAEKTRITPHVK